MEISMDEDGGEKKEARRQDQDIVFSRWHAVKVDGRFRLLELLSIDDRGHDEEEVEGLPRTLDFKEEKEADVGLLARGARYR